MVFRVFCFGCISHIIFAASKQLENEAGGEEKMCLIPCVSLFHRGDGASFWGWECACIFILKQLSWILSITQHSSLFQYYIGKSFSTSFSNLKFTFNHLSFKEYVQGTQKVLNANFGSSKVPNILLYPGVFFFFPLSHTLSILIFISFISLWYQYFLKVILQMKQTKRE